DHAGDLRPRPGAALPQARGHHRRQGRSPGQGARHPRGDDAFRLRAADRLPAALLRGPQGHQRAAQRGDRPAQPLVLHAHPAGGRGGHRRGSAAQGHVAQGHDRGPDRLVPRTDRHAPGQSLRAVDRSRADEQGAARRPVRGLRPQVMGAMRGLLAAAALVFIFANGALASPRVVSLDQCADQYVLALSPREAIAGLSYRAEAGDSYLAAEAKGLPKRRATLESLLATRPEVVLREWGGDAQLVRRLQERGVRVATLQDAADFDGVRANIRQAAAALGEEAKGEALILRMDHELAEAGRRPTGKTAAYLTPGGATAGPGTLVDAMLRAAGLGNAEQGPGYRTLSLERLALQPPQALVLGFFDAVSLSRAWWSPARSGPMKMARRRAMASLPGAVLSCPAWFAADGVVTLAKAAGP